MPESVDGGTVVEMQRMLDETAPGDRARDAVRARVTAYLARRGLDAAHTGDHAQALRTLRSALVHYAPEEIAAGSLPRELGRWPRPFWPGPSLAATRREPSSRRGC